MKKIKITSIALLILLSTYIMFWDIMNGAEMLLLVASFGVLIWLNIEAFKIKGAIKKLVIKADIIFLSTFLLTVISILPGVPNITLIFNFIVCFAFLAFQGFVVAVLVNAYKE